MLMMRIPAAVLAASVCVGFTCSTGPAFAQSAAQRFRAYDGAAHLDAARLAGLHADQNVKVVVVMSEDSIATARATPRAGSRSTSRSARSSPSRSRCPSCAPAERGAAARTGAR